MRRASARTCMRWGMASSGSGAGGGVAGETFARRPLRCRASSVGCRQRNECSAGCGTVYESNIRRRRFGSFRCVRKALISARERRTLGGKLRSKMVAARRIMRLPIGAGGSNMRIDRLGRSPHKRTSLPDLLLFNHRFGPYVVSRAHRVKAHEQPPNR
jgi:hypothetical protein